MFAATNLVCYHIHSLYSQQNTGNDFNFCLVLNVSIRKFVKKSFIPSQHSSNY